MYLLFAEIGVHNRLNLKFGEGFLHIGICGFKNFAAIRRVKADNQVKAHLIFLKINIKAVQLQDVFVA